MVISPILEQVNNIYLRFCTAPCLLFNRSIVDFIIYILPLFALVLRNRLNINTVDLNAYLYLQKLIENGCNLKKKYK